MVQDAFDSKNILVIHFGQLGDVVLGLPALAAIRRRFSGAKITLLTGKSTAEIVQMSGFADDQIIVDRVGLRDGSKLRSIGKIFSLARDIRQRRFDFVIDLHSLYETNLLGYFSGARFRLFANRENRSLDRLSRFPACPPDENKSTHHADRYLAVLEPLGILNAERTATIKPAKENLVAAQAALQIAGVGNRLIGLFLGAGHPTRRWSIDKFVELSRRLALDEENRVLVFLGPEERGLRQGLERRFGESAKIVAELTLPVFFAALSLIDIFVSGDTGPMHLGAVAGAKIVLISELGAPTFFWPLTEKLFALNDCTIDQLSVQKVESAVLEFAQRDKR